MSNEKINYSSAIIEFLDRKSKTKKAMAYPITKITLNNFTDNEVNVFKTFIVKNGKWEESK